MTPAAFLRNYRRILALVLASALLHVLALLLIARAPVEPSAVDLPARLVIAARLAPPPPRPPARAAVAPPSPPIDAPSPPEASQNGHALATGFAVPLDAASMGAHATELPGAQNTRLPASATIRYEVRQRAARAPGWIRAGSATLAWQLRPDGYTLEAASTPDGANAPARTMRSEGIIGDAGIVPERLRDTGNDGIRETVFDRETDRISFSGTDRTAQIGPASQDQLSMLMQLAAVANADPAQMEGSVDVHVGGMDMAGVVRFDVVGLEAIDTPMGSMQALHLAQQADAGRTRVDLWLAPEHGYLPVRMVTRLENGSEVLQAVTSISQ